MATSPTFVIIGGGLAGAKAAEALRDNGFEGRLVLFGAEDAGPNCRRAAEQAGRRCGGSGEVGIFGDGLAYPAINQTDQYKELRSGHG